MPTNPRHHFFHGRVRALPHHARFAAAARFRLLADIDTRGRAGRLFVLGGGRASFALAVLPRVILQVVLQAAVEPTNNCQWFFMLYFQFGICK